MNSFGFLTLKSIRRLFKLPHTTQLHISPSSPLLQPTYDLRQRGQRGKRSVVAVVSLAAVYGVLHGRLFGHPAVATEPLRLAEHERMVHVRDTASGLVHLAAEVAAAVLCRETLPEAGPVGRSEDAS